MQPAVLVHGAHSSGPFHYGFAQDKDYNHEDAEGLQHYTEKLAIVIMPQRTQSPKPNVSVRTHELVSMPRRREDAPLNSHPQHIMMGDQAHQTLSHFEMARLERDRRDWRELAQFLRTHDPPRTNNMSYIEDGERKKKKHAGSLTMFRRTAAKKSPSKGPVKPLQLPDSAVAARTTKGHWHIAISIPLSAISTFADEPTSPLNRVVEEERPGSHSTLPPAYRSASAQNTRTGNISPTPSQNSIHPAPRKERSQTTITDERDRNDTLSGEAATVMKIYYRQERLQNSDETPTTNPQSLDEVLSTSKRSSRTSPTSPTATSPILKRETFGPVYANNDIERNNSQRTDQRHSGGTVHSQQTLETMGHSRGPSAGSTSAQMSDTIAPPRSSSRRTRRSEEGSSDTTVPPGSIRRTESGRGHKNVGSGDSASSIVMLEATEGLQHQVQLAGMSVSVRNAPRTPAPTRALPDLPEEVACPNHPQHERSVSDGGKRVLRERQEKQQAQNVKERWEKVKALKMRDIERQRRRSTHPPLTASIASAPRCQHINSNSEEGKRPKTPKRGEMRSARHAASVPFLNAAAHAANGGISLSPIRTIASTSPSGVQAQGMYSCATPTSTSQSLPDDFLDSLLPSYDYHRLSSVQRHSGGTNTTNISSQPMAEGRRGSARSGRSDRTLRTFTPPRSLSPSFASSDEDGIHVTSPHSITSRHNSHRGSHILRTSSNTSRKRNSYISHHRSRTIKGEEAEDVKEIKERMKRLERDNERILETLQAMVGMQQGVKDLFELLSPERKMTEGEKAVRRVSRTLEDAVPRPLSLRGSPRNSEREEEDMKRRMRELEIEMAAGSLGHRVTPMEYEKLAEERMEETGGGWEELSAVEPLMREVRMNARVSHESRRVCSDEEDEGLGYRLTEQGC